MFLKGRWARMAPVNRVTIHHEGAGKPTDETRGADGGYSYWIGASYWTRLRAPADSFATYHYNGVSLDICLSGDRMVWPVTDHDIQLIRQVCADARNRDELTDYPDVVPHRNSQGSSTVCPGNKTMDRWSLVVAACRVPPTIPPAPWKVQPMFNPPLDLTPIVASYSPAGGGTYLLGTDGGVFAFGCPFKGAPNREPLSPGEKWATIRAWTKGDPKVNGSPSTYVCVTTAGDKYCY